jgi:hypothetical protein
MKFLLLLFLINPAIVCGQFCDSLLLQSITFPGPFLVADIVENEGIRNGPDYSGSTIYYPINNTNPNLSSIVMVPGFMNTQNTIQNWGPFLASHGIITMTIGTNALTDTHVQRRDALLDALISLKNENERIGSPLNNKMDTSSIAVGGFSKGGGGAQLVPSIDSSIKAIVALYPWLENPISSDLSYGVPVIIVSGQLDVIAPPALHADLHYNLTSSSTNKLKYEIAFASHDALSGPYAGGGEVGTRVVSWLKTFLLADSCYCPIIVQDASSSSSYITNINCIEINPPVSNAYYNYSKNLIKVQDLFGREIEIKKNIPLIYIYDNGIIEKRIIIK